ncbi:MAG: cell division protein FtsZ, partial [Pseudomonadota bacterium]|nr:cell division protein FtsZ [Pseudomonadota bacterium]
HSMAPRKIQLGTSLTGGLGAGSKPEMGRKAAEESLDEVLAELADSHMVFITAGMGGGTGTGAAPVVARAAKERGILTVGVVTKPFDFEGKRRMEQADAGVEALQAYVDTLIVIPNQNLFRMANERTTLADTFHMADAVLHQGVCGVTDLMIKPGLINLDFADIRAVMSEMGKAMMGTGEASGETRATEAAESAINNPLLDDSSMKGARAVLINITGGMDMTLFEVDEAANRIRAEVDPDATIIFGSAFDEKLEGVMRVSVVATGIDAQSQSASLPFTDGNATTPATSPQVPVTAKVRPVINFGNLAPTAITQPETSPSVAEQEAPEQSSEPAASLSDQIQP